MRRRIGVESGRGSGIGGDPDACGANGNGVVVRVCIAAVTVSVDNVGWGFGARCGEYEVGVVGNSVSKVCHSLVGSEVDISLRYIIVVKSKSFGEATNDLN